MIKHIIFLLLVLTYHVSSASINKEIKFDANKLNISAVEVNGATYSYVTYGQLTTTAEQNEALTPILSLSFSVPHNAANFRVEYSLSESKNIQLPFPILKGMCEYATGTETHILSSAVTNNEIVQIESIGNVGDVFQIVNLSVRPFNIEEETRGQFYESIDLILKWDVCDDSMMEGKPVKQDVLVAMMKNALSIVDNPEDVVNNMKQQINLYTSDQQEYPYVIIAPSRLCRPLERLAALRRLKGYGAQVFSLEYALNREPITTNVSINDDAGKLKAFITDCFYLFGTRNVLLAGKYPEMPLRYGTATNVYGENLKVNRTIPSDLYFSDVNKSWKSDKDGVYGVKGKDIDYFGEINIGRLAFSDEDEINSFIDKLMIYEFNPGNGDTKYLNKAFMSREDCDSTMSRGYNNTLIKGFLDAYTTNNIIDYSESKIGRSSVYGKTIVNAVNEFPCGVHNFIGHGNPSGVCVGKDFEKQTGIMALDRYDCWNYNEDGNGLDNLTNKFFPGWSFSMSCMTMPLDYRHETNEQYPETYHFGDSYVLGKNYGGVAFIGNARTSYSSWGSPTMNFAFDYLKDSFYKDGDVGNMTAGELITRIRSNPVVIAHDSKLSYNLIGDPLTQLWIKAPNRMNYVKNNNYDKEVHYGFGWNGVDSLWIAIHPIIEPTYSLRHKAEELEIIDFNAEANRLYCIYGKNYLPVILPLYLQNISIPIESNRYIIADKVYCGKYVADNTEYGNVILEQRSNLTIESLSDVYLAHGIEIGKGATLTILAQNEVTIDDILMEENSTLYVKANNIEKHDVDMHPTARIILITDDESTPTKIKARMDQDGAHRPLVVEGRTWWYGRNCRWHFDTNDFGIRIGKEVELAGQNWHEVRLIKTIMHDYNGIYYNAEDKDIVVGYLREEGESVYSRVVSDKTVELTGSLPEQVSAESHLIYSFSDAFTHFGSGNVNEPEISLTITDLDVIDNSGYKYRTWSAVQDDVENGEYRYWSDEHPFKYAEGIGVIGNTASNMLVYYPFGLSADGSSGDQPFLRYVTEDEDNKIIYEAAGGHKLWQVTESVENVDVDRIEKTEYFDVYGRRLEHPTPGSIVVCRQGSKVTKIIVK